MSSSYTSDSFFCDEGGHFLDNSFSDFTLLYESQTGFCRLYRAKRLGKWFVLKCLKPGKVDDEFCRAMLQKEFSIGYNLSHPAIAAPRAWRKSRGWGSASSWSMSMASPCAIASRSIACHLPMRRGWQTNCARPCPTSMAGRQSTGT